MQKFCKRGVSGQVAQPVSVSLIEVKLSCIGSANGWVDVTINNQNNSLRRPSEGTSN